MKKIFKLFKLFSIFIILFFMCQSVWAGCDFNGDADSINCGSDGSIDNFSSFTFSCWVYPRTESVLGRCFDKSDKLSYIADVTKYEVQFKYNDTDAISRVAISLNVWQHWIVTWSTSDNTIRIYINGSEIAYVTQIIGIGTPVDDSANTLYIANRADGTRSCDAIIAEIGLWNTVITSDEISLLSKSKLKRMPLQIQLANLKLYLPLDDHPDGTGINGKTYNDASGNGNDGTGVDADGDSTNKAEEILNYPQPVMSWQ